jgi:hypothetical protein
VNRIQPKPVRLRLEAAARMKSCGSKCYAETAGGVKVVAQCRIWKFTIRNCVARRAMILSRT